MRRFSLDDLPANIAADLACPPGTAVLDIGSGPGSLHQAVQYAQPAARIAGIDPDADMLAHARSAAGGGAWVAGLAQSLPFRDGTFDRVAMTLMLHHLTHEQRVHALSEARRVLREGGRLFVTDWTAPTGFAKASFLIVRMVDGFSRTEDNAKGRLGELIRTAGFTGLAELRRRKLWIGTIAHLAATKPSSA